MGRKSGRKKSGFKKKGSKPTDIEQLKLKLTQFFENNFGEAYAEKQLIKKLVLRDAHTKKLLNPALRELLEEGKISCNPRNLYSSTAEPEFIIGEVDFVNARFAFVIPNNQEKKEDDIMVKEADLKSALDGDKVRVMILPKRGRGNRREGKVLEIMERSRDEFVGRIEISPRFAFVVPDFKKMHHDIFVRKSDLAGAQHNQKVVVKLTDWKEGDKSPSGKIIHVLGKAGDHEVEIHSIMAEFGLPFDYPEEVEAEAESISEVIPEDEIKKRKDFRDIDTFTIDPADAKDFDDAISFRYLDNGNMEIGVHIADVTHYVKPKTLMEKEAYDRATSVYLVDRTIPMLPERLSNGLCSLRPNEDKLTFSCVFEITDQAEVKDFWIGRTVIHSNRRFTYEEAQENMDNESGEYAKDLLKINSLAKLLRSARFKKGAINFETVEVKFQLDESGTPTGLIIKERKDVHKLIEEFMLLANKTVATYIYNKNKGKSTFVYRVHDYPDLEKLATFSNFAKKFGHEIKILDEKKVSNSLNKLMDDIVGKPEQNILEQLAIRSMAKAKYTTEPKQHFGLAFDHYTHFTSPIRRYPDMMVHRLLQHYLDGGKPPENQAWEEKCVHSSEREKRAADAERASIKYKQVEYMKLAEDKDYSGIITGVTEWGVYVEISETKCEGMVRVQDLTDDYYDFDEKNMRLIGAKNKRMITLGDKVEVRVTRTDIDRRTIDLEFVNNDK
ncbi:ribonuclease R [Cyclobacterium marinum]|uniref:Ribonuclease R n=1 Tax=Cyclobacterium marinum (strain ATCC 25205 / DSM 745 / LMG 13164 / NCIMB 1802) TaxID=880070 RepID=G0J2K7_CYCMS|nr:ribonuclease R [Cyclobacterium marinum]AEL25898.1 ribonuclease R [Cyclobacterium marinum DSM 745]|tara:strand:+ start:22795 stop:24972 length:2178 start_codon:yes stop_codon:yes gene_type:complete